MGKRANPNSFQKKTINGKPNPKYVCQLKEDKPIAGQNYVCMSFVAPEEHIKKRELFFFENFLKQWDFSKSMEKFIQFLNFVSFKYKISFETLTEDFKDFVKEEKENLNKSTIEDDYKTFLDHNEDDLQKIFDVKHEFQTSIRGLKIRGVFATEEEANLRCKLLLEEDDTHDIHIGHVGYWMPFDPDAYKTGDVQYMEDELNQLMHEKKKNEQNAKMAFDQRVKETKQKAIEDNIRAAEKTGNVLTQTIDEKGNLIGVNNTKNSIEFSLGEQENVTTQEICNTLFEGDNIITGKNDHGESKLTHNPFTPLKI
jgi:hypothetical protein